MKRINRKILCAIKHVYFGIFEDKTPSSDVWGNDFLG
jgi:hypothetical protein